MKRKAEGKGPKPPKKDRAQGSNSFVWHIFKEIDKDVECRLCFFQLKYCVSSTTNMGKH